MHKDENGSTNNKNQQESFDQNESIVTLSVVLTSSENYVTGTCVGGVFNQLLINFTSGLFRRSDPVEPSPLQTTEGFDRGVNKRLDKYIDIKVYSPIITRMGHAVNVKSESIILTKSWSVAIPILEKFKQSREIFLAPWNKKWRQFEETFQPYFQARIINVFSFSLELSSLNCAKGIRLALLAQKLANDTIIWMRSLIRIGLLVTIWHCG